jgi:hypothetical protein
MDLYIGFKIVENFATVGVSLGGGLLGEYDQGHYWESCLGAA